MADKNLISVIITSYNHADHLSQRIDSLLEQTYKNQEIIIVDDCSTDSSRSVYDRYREFQNINVKFLEKNGGYANATNIGVGLSHGEYLMFAEADDFNDPRQIELLLSCITKDEHIGVVFSKSNIVDANGKIIGDDFQFRESSFKKLCSKNSRIERSAMQKFLLSACVIPNMSAALIRRQYFDIIHGFSTLYKMVADWDFWCRMAQACDFYYVAEPLNNFRSHRNTLRNSIKARKQVYEIFDILYRTISEMRLTPFEQIRYKSNIGFIWAYYLTSDFTLENFFQTWRDNKAHDIFGIIYLVWGFVKSALLVARNYIKKLQQIIK